ncbi:Adhesion G Protein-Coupled Receptor B2 [Manis pentadactyla]|nr:Adhesion G Protein-Coupled Receptor B2 [Manis pentadactyla]
MLQYLLAGREKKGSRREGGWSGNREGKEERFENKEKPGRGRRRGDTANSEYKGPNSELKHTFKSLLLLKAKDTGLLFLTIFP